MHSCSYLQVRISPCTEDPEVLHKKNILQADKQVKTTQNKTKETTKNQNSEHTAPRIIIAVFAKATCAYMHMHMLISYKFYLNEGEH